LGDGVGDDVLELVDQGGESMGEGSGLADVTEGRLDDGAGLGLDQRREPFHEVVWLLVAGR